MLDQNTDRMWYVIGAVIVGAAIILIANGTMPQIFASVAETFESKTDDTLQVVDGIMPFGSNYEHVPITVSAYSGAVLENIAGDYRVTSDGQDYAGVKIDEKYLQFDKVHRLSFEFQKESGDVTTMGGHLTSADDISVYFDGQYIGNSWGSGINNAFPNDSKSHTVVVEFTPRKELVEQYTIHGIFIQPNRSNTQSYKAFSGWIRDLTLTVEKEQLEK